MPRLPIQLSEGAPVIEEGSRQPRRMSLSDDCVEKLKPGAKRYRVTDTRVAGLSVDVGVSGAKTWLLRLPVSEGGRQVWIPIGTFGDVNADVARAKARMHWGAISKDPGAIRAIQGKRGEETFREIVTQWLKEHILPERMPGTFKAYREMMDLYLLPPFGKRTLDQITTQRLRRWHKWMGKHGRKTAADVALRTLSSFFRWAISKGKAETNPARDLPRHNSKVIHRPLDPDGRRKVGQAIQAMMVSREANPIYLKAIQLTMATGLRRRSIAEMQWKDISLDQQFVRVRDKSFRVQGEKLHPLGPIALAILKSVPRFMDCPWVFPGRKLGEHMSVNTLDQIWVKVRTKAGVVAPEEDDRYGNKIQAPNIRLHDLRHTKGAILGSKHKNTMVAATMGLSTIEMANRYGRPVGEEVVQANWEAETALGLDLGILPEAAALPGTQEPVEAPKPVQIVVQITWPFNAPRARKSLKKTESAKAPAVPETKIQWPSREELQAMVLARPVTEVARELGVSDKAVEKRCKALGLEKRPRGYWARLRAGLRYGHSGSEGGRDSSS